MASAPRNASTPLNSNVSSPATISVSPGSIDFGSVPMGSSASQSVTLMNGGGSSLTVTQASTTASGFSLTGISLPLTIGAGNHSNFNVVFSPKSTGTISGSVSIVSDASNSPSTVSVSGTGTQATALLTPTISTLDFGSVAVGANKALSVTLTNTGNSKVTVSNVGVSSASYSVSGVSAGLALTPGQTATLDITFAPKTAGSLPGSVTISSDATDSPATISLAGVGAQAVSHSVLLSWMPSASVVAGYNVYRSTVSGGFYTKLNSLVVPTESYTDSAVQDGLTYYYVVTSVTSSGTESPDSTQASASVPAT
ncbi:MAG TPA: choice-of-anchor D domain-containing protein [Candidatus Acidoferrales bacterium]|nr:choice-of-anchor D domain-containing protein [Candidatus Acidoferrales bacterium]